jgi:PAS domain S-box-containing protein
MRELTKDQKKKVIKDIILQLHHGLSVEEAKEKFEKEAGTISSIEIAEIEQSLINEGLSPEEIKKFCNVHALLFQSALTKEIIKEESLAHPVSLFKKENREIEKITREIKTISLQNRNEIKELLQKLKGIDIHYTRKEQLLFPYLERYGFFGPSKVMWGKDNEIRDLLRTALANVDAVSAQEYQEKFLKPLIEEVEGMVFKEENILFPTSLEKLIANDWVEILKESDEVGYVYIEKPEETTALIEELKKSLIVEPQIKEEGIISFLSGELKFKELMCLFNTLPVDITFVDQNDAVKYFSDGRNRIFVRTKSVIGRKVQFCHPPQSVDKVEEILKSFKEGEKDSADFWINYRGKFIYIRYFAVRDENRNYLGTLEVTQDITEVKKLEGEKRLLDEIS